MPVEQLGDAVTSLRIGGVIKEYQCNYDVGCLYGAGGTNLASVIV